MKINGKSYRLNSRGRKVKTAIEFALSGCIGAALSYVIITHWFG